MCTNQSQNLIANGSFELGLHNNWVHPYFYKSPRAMTDDTTATHGQCSLKFSTETKRPILCYKTILAAPDQVFTFAADFKTDGQNVSLHGVRTPLNDAWQRLSFPVSPKDGLLTLHLGIRGKGNVWIDGATLVEGTNAAAFTPATDIEAAICMEKPGNIFLEKNPVVVHVQSISYSKKIKIAPQLSIWNYWNEKIWERNIKLNLKSGQIVEKRVKIPLKLFGAFRAELRLSPNKPVIAERVFTRMRNYTSQHAKANSPVCGHYGSNVQLLERAQRLGVTINRLHDGTAAFLWRDIERQQGKWSFDAADKIVDDHERLGLEILGILAAAPDWATGEPNLETWPGKLPGRTHLADWENYVETVVGRYKGRVKYWEVWNEPYDLPPDYYFEIAKRAYQAAKRAWSEVQIVAPGGYRLRYWWMHAVNEMGILNYCDIYSFHCYGTMGTGAEPMIKLGRADGKNRPVWDTESGGDNYSTFYKHFVSPSAREPRTPQSRAVITAQDLLSLYAAGINRRFWYWNYGVYAYRGVAAFTPSSCFEYDGSVHPVGVANSLAGIMIAGLKPAGEIDLGSARTAYLFEGPQGCIATLWDNRARLQMDLLTVYDPNWTVENPNTVLQNIPQRNINSNQMTLLTLTLPKKTEVLDIMTNPAKLDAKNGSVTIPLSSSPVYMTFPLGAKGVCKLFEKCSVANVGYNDLDIRPGIGYDNTSGRTGLMLRLCNQRNRPTKGLIELISVKGADLETNMLRFDLKEFERKNVTAPIRKGSGFDNKICVKYTVITDAGTTTTNEFIKRVLTAYRFDNPPEIDGDMSDWPVNEQTAIEPDTAYLPQSHEWSRVASEDISAQIWAGWDSDWLYFLVKVRDDNYIPAWELPSEFWSQDAVEFFFDLDLWGDIDNPELSADDYQVLTVAGVSNAPDAPSSNLTFPGTKLGSQRLPDGYVIEYAFPLKYMLPLKGETGRVLGFDVAVDDTDTPQTKRGKPNRKQQLQWSTRKWAIWRSPSGYGTIYLAP
ncbi:MAG: endo-1,4-beta-xylanase [Lentisphaerae bacterium]|nr:endo-1,4-beta-xylanase [Lentisphaerota bacterium]